jgi:hypothetical protein
MAPAREISKNEVVCTCTPNWKVFIGGAHIFFCNYGTDISHNYVVAQHPNGPWKAIHPKKYSKENGTVGSVKNCGTVMTRIFTRKIFCP